MMASMPHRVFAEWQRYYSVEPFGEERADLRMGIQTAATMSALSAQMAQWAGQKRGKRFKPQDFMPCVKLSRGGPRQPLPDKVLFQKVLILNRLYGGTVIDKRKK